MLILGRVKGDCPAELQAVLYQGISRAVSVHGAVAADLFRRLLQPLAHVGEDRLKGIKEGNVRKNPEYIKREDSDAAVHHDVACGRRDGQ